MHNLWSTYLEESHSYLKQRWAHRLQGFSLDSVWTEFTPLAVNYKAVNLGQGFPDFPGPKFILEAARKAIKANVNQYSRAHGHVKLVHALAQYFSPLFDRPIDPMSEVLTTIGN
jgi:aspartate/methionine/tyrosine aminotransferase